MKQDIILVTVDALRYDSPSLMPNTMEYFGSDGQTEAITSGAATNWVFPGILSGSFYPSVYNDSGTIRESFASLPGVLNEYGYSTGAFLGFNPYLSKWHDRFATFWNGGLDRKNEEWYSHTLEKWVNRGYRSALLKKRVPGGEVIRRATRWYQNHSGPKFLWVHLMEPHKPYYPGIRKARDVGLLDAYKSIVSFQRHGDRTPRKHVEIQRQLYEKCVEKVDALIPQLLSVLKDDSTILVLGDHGEEFSHGHYGHERLYDECVRVPLFFENISELSIDGCVRQIDLAPSILHELSIDVPKNWDGRPASLSNEPALMLTPQSDVDLLHVGIRSDKTKLIQSFRQDSGQLVQSELYDLTADPQEKINIIEERTVDGLEDQLNTFISEHESALEMDAITGSDSEVVKARLEDLGYK